MRKFKSFEKMEYQSLYGDPRGSLEDVKITVFDYLQDEYDKYKEVITEVIFGTDAKRIGKHTVFSTALVLRKEGKGARVFRCKYKVPFIESINEKLMYEAIRAHEFALNFTHIFDHFIIIPDIHVDVNTDERHRSNRVMKQVFAYIESQGYNCILKPNAWVSSKVCDRVVNKGV